MRSRRRWWRAGLRGQRIGAELRRPERPAPSEVAGELRGLLDGAEPRLARLGRGLGALRGGALDPLLQLGEVLLHLRVRGTRGGSPPRGRWRGHACWSCSRADREGGGPGRGRSCACWNWSRSRMDMSQYVTARTEALVSDSVRIDCHEGARSGGRARFGERGELRRGRGAAEFLLARRRTGGRRGWPPAGRL